MIDMERSFHKVMIEQPRCRHDECVNIQTGNWMADECHDIDVAGITEFLGFDILNEATAKPLKPVEACCEQSLTELK